MAKQKEDNAIKYSTDAVTIISLGVFLIFLGLVWIFKPGVFETGFKAWQILVFGTTAVLGGLVLILKTRRIAGSGEEIIEEIRAMPLLLAGFALILIGYSFVPDQLKKVSASIDVAGFLCLFLWVLIVNIKKEKAVKTEETEYVEKIIGVGLIWLGCWVTLLLTFEGASFNVRRFDFRTITNIIQIFLPITGGVLMLLMSRR